MSLRPYTHPWVLPHPEKKRSTCDDASTITLMVRWWFFVPFGIRGRVLYSLSGNHPQCPFIQMTYTDVTFLSCYNIVGHARVCVITLTSPPPLPLSRLWAELSVRRFLSSPLLIQGSSLLSVLPSLSQRLLEVQKFDSERYPQSSHPHWDLVRTPKPRPLPPFHPPWIASS